MVFSSTIFLFLFIPVFFILYFNPLARGRKYKNIILLLSSIGFYAWGEPLFVFAVVAMAFINWFMGIMICESRGKKTCMGG